MQEKLLTVVVPVYNTERWLRRCLDSVLCAEFAEALELIAVNDGSTDASLAILQDYQARWPETFVLIDQANGGHGEAVNAGLRAASGRYFRVLDSDDWLDTPGFLRFMARLPQCREDLIVTPYTQEYTATGAEVRCDYPYLRNDQIDTMDGIDWREGMNYFTLASSTWRTALLRESGLRLPEKCSYVDMLYNLWPIPYVQTIRFLDIPLYRYFLGRPEQSMDPKRMRRQTPMHQAVLCRLVEYYSSRAEVLSPGARRYMLLVIGYMLHTHCALLLAGGRRRAYRELRALDAWIRDVSPEVYRLGVRIPYLRLSRRLGYLNVLLLDRRAVSLLSELRQRLRRRKGAEGTA